MSPGLRQWCGSILKGTAGILCLILLLCRTEVSSAAREKSPPPANPAREMLIGSTIKSIAKAYVAVSDLESLKKTNIKKLEKMSNAEFRERFDAIYEDLQELPQGTRDLYGIKEGMDRKSAMGSMKAVEKRDLYRIIDDIPDAFIARHFDAYVTDACKNSGEGSALRQLKGFWSGIRKKIEE
jgi:hypothetical protein